MTIQDVKKALSACSDQNFATNKGTFFKNSDNDIILGIKNGVIRKMAKDFLHLSFSDLSVLCASEVHEERFLAHVILCSRYKKANESGKKEIFDFYLTHRHHIRNWDGVDDSAPYIVGPYLLEKDKDLLFQLAHSPIIWDRRIAIVSTWWFIRNNQLETTLKLAEVLINDKEDLIHKGVGWMLREVGERDELSLRQFLDQHHQHMPRTMLRYAIEKMTEELRKHYLAKKK